jgi:hypothetical protein
MPRSRENRRRPVARAVALRPPPQLPVLDRDLVTAALGVTLLVAALLLR